MLLTYVASTVSVRTLTKNLKKLTALLLNILIKFNLLGRTLINVVNLSRHLPLL